MRWRGAAWRDLGIARVAGFLLSLSRSCFLLPHCGTVSFCSRFVTQWFRFRTPVLKWHSGFALCPLCTVVSLCALYAQWFRSVPFMHSGFALCPLCALPHAFWFSASSALNVAEI